MVVARATGCTRELDGATRGAGEVGALSVSSQGISFVPVDDSGRALYNAINWLDNRASVQAERLARIFGSAGLFLRTGKRASPSYTLPKLMWLKEERPEVYRGAWKFLMGLDFITHRLTGCCSGLPKASLLWLVETRIATMT